MSNNSAVNQTQQSPVIGGVKKTKTCMRLQSVFNVDGTGSSTAFAQGITNIQKQLATELPIAVQEVEFGQYITRDLDYDDPQAALVLSLENATAIELTQAADAVVYSGGGDEDESFLDGLLDLAQRYPWSYELGVRRAVVLMASSSTKTAKDGRGLQEVADEFVSKQITLLVVATSSSNLHELAKKANGLSFILSNTPDANEIKQVVSRLTASLSTGRPTGTVINSLGGGLSAIGKNGTVPII